MVPPTHLGHWQALPGHWGSSTLLMAQGPMAAPCHQPPTRWCCGRASLQIPPTACPAMGASRPGPRPTLSLWLCLAIALSPGQQSDFLAWPWTCLMTLRFPGFSVGPGPHLYICPTHLPVCGGQPWAARDWHRELHSSWHPSCWMMCKVLTSCEHLKFPSYLFHQNRSIISGVLVRFSLIDYIQASQITCQAVFIETHLYGIHLDRNYDFFFLLSF